MASTTFDLSTSMQKGRVGEDIVSLGFRMLGFEVYRTGIENTVLKVGYETVQADPTKDPEFRLKQLRSTHLFRQVSRLPDFLLVKDGNPYWAEVKFRKPFEGTQEEDFVDYLVKRYLGYPKDGSETTEMVPRKLQTYWPMYYNVYLLLLFPDNAKMAMLGDLLAVYHHDFNKDGKKIILDVPKSGKRNKWDEAWAKDNELRDGFNAFEKWYQATLQGKPMNKWIENLETTDKLDPDDSIPELSVEPA